MKKPLKWIPLWIDPWLFGSTRIELTLPQRAIWIDLLTLAGKDSGFIRANEGVAYPLGQLAGYLSVPVDILSETIDRLIETKKLTRLEDGTLFVTKWNDYQISAQYRRRISPPSHTLPSENNRVEYSKGKRKQCFSERKHSFQKEKLTDSLPPKTENEEIEDSEGSESSPNSQSLHSFIDEDREHIGKLIESRGYPWTIDYLRSSGRSKEADELMKEYQSKGSGKNSALGKLPDPKPPAASDLRGGEGG